MSDPAYNSPPPPSPMLLTSTKVAKWGAYMRGTTVYATRDVWGFHIVNFPNLSGNIPLSPTYGVYISQLVRMARIHYVIVLRTLIEGISFLHTGFCSKAWSIIEFQNFL